MSAHIELQGGSAFRSAKREKLTKVPRTPHPGHQSHFPSSIACHYLILLAVKSSAFSRMHPADLLP